MVDHDDHEGYPCIRNTTPAPPGAPVTLAAPTAAIDLPLKALAWKDGDGKVWLSYNDPQYLKRRFGLTDDDIKGIAGAGSLIEQALK